MNDSEAHATRATMPPLSGFLRLSTLILLIANLLPLAGMILWGWDAFLLLMLYWMETCIVAGWTVTQIALSPPDSASRLTVNGKRQAVTSFGLAGFFALHSGIFIGVHLLFLWILFSGDWSQRTGGFFGFFPHAVVTEGLWAPLLLMFFARGAFLLTDVLPERMLRRTSRAAAPSDRESVKKMDGILMGLYGRIIVMQVAIIVGAWFASMSGSIAPFILMILGKTIADLIFQAGANRARTPAAIGGVQ